MVRDAGHEACDDDRTRFGEREDETRAFRLKRTGMQAKALGINGRTPGGITCSSHGLARPQRRLRRCGARFPDPPASRRLRGVLPCASPGLLSSTPLNARACCLFETRGLATCSRCLPTPQECVHSVWERSAERRGASRGDSFDIRNADQISCESERCLRQAHSSNSTDAEPRPPRRATSCPFE